MTKLCLRIFDCGHSRVQYICVFVIRIMINCKSVVKLQGKTYIAGLKNSKFQ